MDIGIHVSLWTPEWESPFHSYIKKAADLEFDLVEIPIMNPEFFPLDQVKRVLKETGLKVCCGTGLSQDKDISSTDSGIFSAGRDHLLRCIDIASELGSPSLQGVIHSAWGTKKHITSKNREASARGLKEIAKKAAGLNLKIALECINRYESSFLNTADQGLDMLERISEDNVGLHLDTYHMNIEENLFSEVFETVGTKLFHLHLSENQRGFPGSGIINWEKIIKEAKNAGYKGPWVIESYVYPDFPAGKDVCIWRSIEKDPENDLKLSLKMLRNII